MCTKWEVKKKNNKNQDLQSWVVGDEGLAEEEVKESRRSKLPP